MSIDLKAEARRIINDHARDVEFMSVVEMLDDVDGNGELDEDDYEQLAKDVHDLIYKARITVTWDDDPDGTRCAAAELVKVARKQDASEALPHPQGGCA